MITLGDVQSNIEVQNVAGCVPTSPQFISLVNSTVDRLIKRGDWAGTVVPIRVCVMKGCITWPRNVGQVRYINGCRRQIAMRSQWYEFLQWDGPRRLHEWQGWCGQEREMELQYRAPTYQDIYGPNCQVRVYPRYAADVGATVQIFGIDNNGQPLQTEVAPNVWQDGITITVASPFGVSTGFISRIDRVLKSVTQGPLNMYAWDTMNNQLWDLAQYEPSETSPSYLRYQLRGGGNGRSCQGSPCLETIIAMVKLQHIPVKLPSDLVLISDMGAMVLSFMALKEESNKNFTAANSYWQLAINELNRQLENEVPDSQLAVRNNVFGGRTFSQKQF